ncbi:MAG: clan AA aspartic protease, partial [Candidatus Zixiibacteriota bacterium]
MREKAVFIEDIYSRDAFYDDYREIEGMLVPFWTKEVDHQVGQVQETKLTLYSSNPEIDPALFEPPEEGAKDYQFVEGDCAENIPFEYIGNHLYIPVVIRGKERLWALDTGAPVTVLNKAFAEELGLELEGDIKGSGAVGTVHASFTTLPPFSVKCIRFEEQTAAVVDMNELIKRLGIDMVGILGFDFLSRFVTK